MKVLIFSDSHGNTSKMIEVIQDTKHVDLIIHLGDIVKDAEEIECIFKSIRFEYIRGNNDWYSETSNEKILELEGKRFLITHGNLYGVKNSYEKIVQRGIESQVDAILFGHTHIAYEGIHSNIQLINPGSITLPAQGQVPSYCIIDISKEKINTKFVRIQA